jgi:hypothetical protein
VALDKREGCVKGNRPVERNSPGSESGASSHVSKNARPFDKVRAGYGAPGVMALSRDQNPANFPAIVYDSENPTADGDYTLG